MERTFATMRVKLLGLLTLALLTFGCAHHGKGLAKMFNPGTFTLWQLPSQTPSQMMSYVIRTTGGRVIVVDGGMTGDAPYLRQFLAEQGNQVDAWFMTHQHDDHCGALTEILKQPGELKIKAIYDSEPDAAWVEQYVPRDWRPAFYDYVKLVKASGAAVVDLQLGQEIKVDGARIEVLGIRNPELTTNDLNNESVVLRVSDRRKSVIFLGDLGPEAGEKLLKNYRHRLHADYVQMAHHGQNGVSRDVYEAIGAKYALWPTPRWLWNNDKGEGQGSGPWKTLEVRKWMEELGIRHNYVSMDGLTRID